MTRFAARNCGKRPARFGAAALAAAIALSSAWAEQAAASTPAPAPSQVVVPDSSSLDALLFYQLLIAELELKAGRAGNAYQVMLDAAKRQGDEQLFQRAVDIALQARAGDQALAATLAWRAAKPYAVAPLRYQTQILLALNRVEDTAEPLATWLAAVPVMERPPLLASLPRLLQHVPDAQRALALSSKLVGPYLDAPGTRVDARVALGRAHLRAGQPVQALGLARAAVSSDNRAAAPVLLALDMLPAHAEAEALVTAYLALPDAAPGLRLAYARSLTQSQRYAEATRQLERLVQDQPRVPEPWLTLGALRLELKRPREAEMALQRYIELASGPAETPAATAPSAAATPSAPSAAPSAAATATANDDNDEELSLAAPGAPRDLTQGWLLLAQAAEQRGDIASAEGWLARIDNPKRWLEVQSRRAGLLARQGKLAEGRALIQAVAAPGADEARAKLMAEAQLLRDQKQWRDAAALLAAGSLRFVDDVDLLYERAMVEEKLDRLLEMEDLLRQVIKLKVDHPHAHNALGYSLADRGLRLDEARELIRRALALSPGDPFITDSLGWVEFRMGNHGEALRLLRQAYSARPDTEIAAHLGEVLWVAGQRDEARRIWLDARTRDANNEVLREALTRLKVGL